MTADVLVIGYGNELRGDDGVGPRVARAVAAWNLPTVRAIDARQLTPEMAELLSLAQRAIFVDATMDNKERVTVEPVMPHECQASLGHISEPGWLLALTRQVFGYCPNTVLVTIPVAKCSFGEGLSAQAEMAMTEALPMVAALIENYVRS